MRRFSFIVGIAAPLLLSTAAAAQVFTVDPEAGNNSFSAVFDADIGERIIATSSAVGCTATFDEKSGTISGTCSVPLLSVAVDNDDTKTEHFQQWATQKKSAAKECTFTVAFSNVVVGTLQPMTPAKFTTQAPFTICGRKRTDGGLETIQGTALLFAQGGPADRKKVRVRATVAGFSRDKYQIGPKYTDGWAARVQSLASVVADEGKIELSLFFKEQASPPPKVNTGR